MSKLKVLTWVLGAAVAIVGGHRVYQLGEIKFAEARTKFVIYALNHGQVPESVLEQYGYLNPENTSQSCLATCSMVAMNKPTKKIRR
jgi:hypothetical protein